ncbi:MAG: LysM peptidoglycan-binding domain-containing protein [Chloroflexi bacterium]|nr:LysM peptidoglycan-binding domain-containing protein [Chloroflexota bacterium]
MNRRRLALFLALNALVSVVAATGAFLLLRRVYPTATDGAPAPRQTILAGEAATATSLAPPVDLSRLPTVTPIVYVVESGDTLGAIAIHFDVSVEDLMAANGLTDPNVLEVGQILIIPYGIALAATRPVFTESSPTPGAPFATATLNPNTAAPRLVVQQVLAPGDLPNEAVRLANLGGAVDLAGWSLENPRGDRYLFPSLTLFQNGAVTIHTRAGTNSVIDLFWGALAPVWQVGDTLTLRRPDGAPETTFAVK